MPRALARPLPLLLLVACGGKDPVATCEDFAACDGGVCVLGACEPLPTCDGACPEPTVAVADTNLRACMGPAESGADGTIACAGDAGADTCATTDFCGQDAQYDHETDRFARDGGEQPVVHDAITGLDWQGCSVGQSGAGCAGDAALSDWHAAVAACEEADWGGFDDWRLPRAAELYSLADFSTTSPAIDLAAFPNAPSRFAEDYDTWWMDCVWSATDYAGDADVAWALMANSGDLSQGSGTTYHHHDKGAEGWEGCWTRCVRGAEPEPHARFLGVGTAEEPVVADLDTQRLWMGCSAGQSGASCDGEAAMADWKGALALCEGLSYGGIDDWRLPDVRELRSLADLSRQSPAIDPVAFPNTPYYGPSTVTNVGQFWSSTARNYNSFALYVDFGSGFSHFYVMEETRHVRCVSG